MAKDAVSNAFSRQLDDLYNNIVNASNSKSVTDKKNENKFGNASAFGDQGAAHVAGGYINNLDNRKDVSDEKTADAANKMAATLATNGTGTTTTEDLNNAMNAQKKEFGSDKDMSYDDNDVISAFGELISPSEGNSHNLARRATNALKQLANAPGQLIGNGLDAAFDGVIGNLAGAILGDEVGDSVKNAFNGDDLSIVGDIGTDIALMALGPAGWAAMAGKNIAQHGNDIADVVAGEDYLTGQELDGSQVAGRLGSTLLDAAVPIRAAKAAKGATKVAEKVADKADDAAKAAGEAVEEAATEGAEKAATKEAKEAAAKGTEEAAAKDTKEAAAESTEKAAKYKSKNATEEATKAITGKATNEASNVLNKLLSRVMSNSGEEVSEKELKALIKKGAENRKFKHNQDKIEENNILRRLSPNASAYARNNGSGTLSQIGNNFKSLGKNAIANAFDTGFNLAKNNVDVTDMNSLKQVAPNLIIASLLGRTPTTKKHSSKSIAEALGNKATKANPYKKTAGFGKGTIIDPKRQVARHAQNVLTRDALGRYGDLYGLGKDEMSTGQLYDQINDIFSDTAYGEEE